MSPAFWGWAIPLLLSPFALYFALRRRAARSTSGVQVHSKKMLTISALLTLPVVAFLIYAIICLAGGDTAMWIPVIVFAGITVTAVVQYVRAWNYRLEVVGDSVHIVDVLKGDIVVRPDTIAEAVKIEVRGARNYKIRLKDGTKLTLNAGEFNLGPLQRVLEAKDAKYRSKNKRK